MNWNVFAWITSSVETPLMGLVDALMGTFLSEAALIVKGAATLFVIIYGFLILSGRAQPGPDFIAQAAKLGGVLWFAYSGYNTYVYDFMFISFPAWLSSKVTGTALDTNAFDSLWLKAWESGMLTIQMLGQWDFMEKGVVVVYWIGAALATLFCFSLWMISKVFLAMTIIVGPLFIALFMFQATRGFVERWVGALVGMIILQFSTVLMLTIMVEAQTEIMGKVATGAAAGNPYVTMQTLFSALIFFGVTAFASLHLPAFATQFAGGLSFHTGAIARGTYGAAAKSAKMVGGKTLQAGGVAAATTAQAGGRAASQAVNNFRNRGGSVSRSTGTSLGDGTKT